MRGLNAPVLFNLENWGLVEHDLPETSPAVNVAAAALEVGR